MSAIQFIPSVGISMTPAAVEHMQKQITKNPNALGLRISLREAGCSGYKYDTSLATDARDDDEVLHISEHLDVYISRKHLPIVQGTQIDYVTEGLNKTLVFKNPNVTGECGCGESFSVN